MDVKYQPDSRFQFSPIPSRTCPFPPRTGAEAGHNDSFARLAWVKMICSAAAGPGPAPGTILDGRARQARRPRPGAGLKPPGRGAANPESPERGGWHPTCRERMDSAAGNGTTTRKKGATRRMRGARPSQPGHRAAGRLDSLHSQGVFGNPGVFPLPPGDASADSAHPPGTTRVSR